MVQFINRPPSFGEQLAKNLGGGFSQGMNNSMEFAQKMALEEKKASLKKKEEKAQLGQVFSGILGEMKGLKEYVGPSLTTPSSWNPWSDESGKRSQIDTLRLSLEGLFRDLTLKGQFPKAIYERILKELPSSKDTPGQYENKIDAVQKILDAHYGEKGGAEFSEKKSNQGKVKFNPRNSEHKAKMNQLEKLHKGDRAKVNRDLAREFE